jgi:hypothetical protein
MSNVLGQWPAGRCRRIQRAVSTAAAAVAVLVVLAMGGRGQTRAPQSPSVVAPLRLTLLVTDDPIPARKIVPALTSGNSFAEVFISASTPILRQGKRIPLTAIKPGFSLVCQGDWTDATRSTFRAASVRVEGNVPSTVFRERVALACQKLAGRTRPALVPQVTRPTRVTPVGSSSRSVSAMDDFVLEDPKLVKGAEGKPEPGTENAPYYVTGVLRNISGIAYDRVEVQLSVLDRDGKKIADQNATGHNVRPADRWQFRAEPPVYLPYRQGQSIRVEKIMGMPRADAPK